LLLNYLNYFICYPRESQSTIAVNQLGSNLNHLCWR